VKEIKVSAGFQGQFSKCFTRNIIIVHDEGELEITLHTETGQTEMPIIHCEEILV
jgi:hypothetical protein